ncbi:arylsulfatase B-like [Schistocerca serialis cubense]|uniref:arylsulfatase B-like n=1 Tax=Schistocerca serialis cubense TaxID=2023355 RepID=UPI00214EFA0B|nr:arylsulfatase B-like [Schistocerca serialis cubense]
MSALFAAVWLLIAAGVGHGQSTPPNIIFIIADDLGWNDLSFHGSDQIPTPNIDALAYNGIILNSHYVMPTCTPSRASLLTGKYPIRLGMQGAPLNPTIKGGLPEGKILPQYLKDLGYVTRAIGKWHLGFHKKELTPTYRGFDSHLGYWNGHVGYYDIILDYGPDGLDIGAGYDMHSNMTTAWEFAGRYATDVFTEEAERLIQQHDVQRPLFLYLAHQAVHAGDAAKWLDAPQHVINKFLYISDPNRRILAGVLWKLDESVGRVVAALEKRGMLENSIIVFVSDNGAPSDGMDQPNWSSNHPHRGLKGSLWEGGVRGAALVWSPLLQSAPRVSNQLMHISDWLPTLYTAAGGNLTDIPSDLDGMNTWDALVTASDWPRTEVLINRNDDDGTAAIRVGDWKLVKGPASSNGYYGASGAEDPRYTPQYDPQQVVNSLAGRAVASVLEATSTSEDMLRLRAEATVSCPNRPEEPACVPQTENGACVFNVVLDPCEGATSDNSSDVLDTLLVRLEALSDPMLPVQENPVEPELVRPSRWNNTWVPWTDCIADPTYIACNVVT